VLTLTGFTYFISIILMREYFDTSYVDVVFIFKIVAITVITWAPLHILSFIVELCDPSEHKKLMEH